MSRQVLAIIVRVSKGSLKVEVDSKKLINVLTNQFLNTILST
ncbi:hypothetical protein CDIMF43_200360 [Carnobacterium divergens]|nr:hypothetical protein CDIMF43_200360 [Carnobacterium divergens]